MLERDKKEMLIELNSFDKPAMVSGKEAWIKLITNLFFIKKGTYPSTPMLGIDIPKYDYEFMDTALDVLPSEIMEQVRLFLPDIPLDTVTVDTTDVSGRKILLIILVFIDNSVDDTAVVAMDIAQNIIDFEISI